MRTSTPRVEHRVLVSVFVASPTRPLQVGHSAVTAKDDASARLHATTFQGMNEDTRALFAEAERAVRRGASVDARAKYIEAGDAAVALQLWRSAVRCYRHALELDVADRTVVERVTRMPARVIAGRGWDEYLAVLDASPDWPHFGCRTSQVVIGDLGAVVECPAVGPVLELIMSEPDLVETRPDVRFRGMPLAMSLVILRRAMWPVPLDRGGDAGSIRVGFDGRQQVLLDELGDWQPVTRARERR
jgi:hypothetical protein